MLHHFTKARAKHKETHDGKVIIMDVVMYIK